MQKRFRRNYIRRILAIALTATLVMAQFTACNDKNTTSDSEEIVLSETPNVGSGIYYGEKQYGSYILTEGDKYSGVITKGKIEAKTSTLYAYEASNAKSFDLYFIDGDENIPYISTTELTDILNSLYHDVGGDTGANFTREMAENIVNISRENGACFSIDLNNNMIAVDDYDLAFAYSGAANPLDIVTTGAVSSSDCKLLTHEDYAYKGGNQLSISLDNYAIHLASDGKEGYLPLALANDVFINTSYYELLYNGEKAFLIAYSDLKNSTTNELTDIGKIYYSKATGQRPESLIEYTYRELCLALDLHYGLKSEHNISDFNSYIVRTGLYDELTSADPEEFYIGLQDLTSIYFNDGHSGAVASSAYSGDITITREETLAVSIESLTTSLLFSDARKSATGSENAAGYEEYGDTAYVTFDAFIIDDEKDYEHCELVNDASDTIMLILYANQQIHREGSPIKNVVIDLSNNGGGMADAAAAVVAWYLGYANIQVKDVLTETVGSSITELDANRNGQFGESEDSVKDLNRYCIISPVSFSCGNLVPSLFKQSGTVTILGKTSGGGACVVQPMATADGCIFACSGRKMITTAKNGNYVSVDSGVTPDIYISDINNFYNKEYLAKIING